MRFNKVRPSLLLCEFISDRVEVCRHTCTAKSNDCLHLMAYSLGCRYARKPSFFARTV